MFMFAFLGKLNLRIVAILLVIALIASTGFYAAWSWNQMETLRKEAERIQLDLDFQIETNKKMQLEAEKVREESDALQDRLSIIREDAARRNRLMFAPTALPSKEGVQAIEDDANALWQGLMDELGNVNAD